MEMVSVAQRFWLWGCAIGILPQGLSQLPLVNKMKKKVLSRKSHIIVTKQTPAKPDIKIYEDDDKPSNSEVNITLESWGDDEYEEVTESEKEDNTDPETET